MSNEKIADANSKPRFRDKRWGKYFFGLAAGFGYIAVWLWCIGFACCLDDNWWNGIAWGLALAIAMGISILIFRYRRTRPWVPLMALAMVFGISYLGLSTIKPSHDRDWGSAQGTLPFAEIISPMFGRTESVVVHNIRAIRYGPDGPDGGSHYDDMYDLSKLESVWFGVDHFTDVQPLAHTFLSFGFEPGTHRTNYLAFSAEARREKDERMYSPIRGIFKNYELIYVIADEQDAYSGRSGHRENIIQLYPVRATKEQMRTMFRDMVDRTNSIREQPEFYHTLTNNCTTNIVYHTNKVIEKPISAWERGVVFPGYADWLAYRMGIIDTELPLEEARVKFRIDQRVKEYDGTSDFSEFIRGR
jgi:hypothetical protein